MRCVAAIFLAFRAETWIIHALFSLHARAKVGSKRRQRRHQEAIAVVLPKRHGWLFPSVLGAIIAGFLVALASQSTTSKVLPTPVQAISLLSLGDFAAMPSKQLEQQDIALLNLRCAEGLPGAEKLDVQQCLATLDQWARRVRFETERHLYRAHDPRYAKQYRNSEAYLRASMMLQVLQEDCGVHYNHDRIRDVDFTRSQDLFLHGMVGSDNGGTCVSMPVLYIAIGRRLGYPFYLTTAKEHVFCRWDDGKERFNIEGSGEGFSSLDDSYYMKWPKPISEAEIKAGEYLQSLNAAESFAVFLAARGHCLEDNGRRAEARVSYVQAAALAPKRTIYQGYLVQSMGFARSPAFQQVRQPPNPAMVYSPYEQRYIPSEIGYSPYHAAKPVVRSAMGTLDNPPGFPVWP
jgi:hypothetical protein